MKRRGPLILLDRDGTLIRENHYPGDPAQVELLPGAVEGLRRLKKAKLPLIVVSNQSGVGRGILTRAQVKRVQRRFVMLLRRQGITLDGYYWCPHRPSDRCGCRKPKLRLAKQAAKDLKLPWRRSISIGDRSSDVALGQKTGGWGILVLTGYGRQWAKNPGVRPDHTARDFRRAVPWILRRAATERNS